MTIGALGIDLIKTARRDGGHVVPRPRGGAGGEGGWVAGTIADGNIALQSQVFHLENPYWKTFDPYVKPLLDRPMDLRRHEELDTSKDVVVPQ